jgi:hypothetical protein
MFPFELKREGAKMRRLEKFRQAAGGRGTRVEGKGIAQLEGKRLLPRVRQS